MDVPLGEQIISLIGTLFALVVAGFTVAGILLYGPVTGCGLFGAFMGALASSRFVIGRSIRPRHVPASPATDDNDGDDD